MLAVDVHELLFGHGVRNVGLQLATWLSRVGSATSPSSTPASCRTSCTSSLTLCSLLLMQLHSVPYKHSRCDLSRSLPESCRQSCSTCTQSIFRCPTKSNVELCQKHQRYQQGCPFQSFLHMVIVQVTPLTVTDDTWSLPAVDCWTVQLRQQLQELLSWRSTLPRHTGSHPAAAYPCLLCCAVYAGCTQSEWCCTALARLGTSAVRPARCQYCCHY